MHSMQEIRETRPGGMSLTLCQPVWVRVKADPLASTWSWRQLGDERGHDLDHGPEGLEGHEPSSAGSLYQRPRTAKVRWIG